MKALDQLGQVTLYHRPDCHLCEEAREALERLKRQMPFTLSDVDISGDLALEARYGERIPVVAVDGEVVCFYRVSERRLTERLALGSRRGEGP
jgi:glutaredoxin